MIIINVKVPAAKTSPAIISPTRQASDKQFHTTSADLQSKVYSKQKHVQSTSREAINQNV
jgi:hypothetical protein